MNSSDGMLIVNVSAIQAVAIAAVTYYFGAWLRKKVPLLEKYSVPSPPAWSISASCRLISTPLSRLC